MKNIDGLTLVLGGARSGKSSFAENLIKSSALPVTYIATAQVYDEEMRQRVEKHQCSRPQNWLTEEAPYDIHKLLQAAPARAYLIDCLTLYLSNHLLLLEEQQLSDEEVEASCLLQVELLLQAAAQCRGPVIVVSNEVGQGVVPSYPLGRLFRDISGWANQRLAAAAKQVFYCVAGIPVELKRLQWALANEGKDA